MAQDHRIKDTAERHHGTVELLLNALWFSQVKRLNVQGARLGHFLSQLLDAGLREVILVTNEKHELAQAALEKLPGDCRADSSSRASEKHTFTSELVLESQRRFVRLCNLRLLLDDGLGTRRLRWLHCEEVRNQIAEAKALHLSRLLFGGCWLRVHSWVSLRLSSHFQI